MWLHQWLLAGLPSAPGKGTAKQPGHEQHRAKDTQVPTSCPPRTSSITERSPPGPGQPRRQLRHRAAVARFLIPGDVPATHRALVGVFPAASAPREHPCKINGAQQQVSTPFSFSASDLGFDRSSHSPSVCLTSTVIYSAELDTFQTSYYTTVCSNTNICSVAQQQFC